MFDFLTDDVRREPWAVYAQMRAASPVLKAPPNGPWLVFDYAGVRRALEVVEDFSSAAGPGGATEKTLPWMIFYDPPRHTKLRALVSRAFTPRSISALEPRIAELSRQLLVACLSRGAGGREVDLVADYAAPLPVMVIAEMLGIPPADREKFRRWSDAMLGLSETIFGDAAAGARAGAAFLAAHGEMEEYLVSVLANFRSAPQDNLLHRLAVAEVDGQRLSHEEILGFFQLLLLAGSETTINLISNAVLCFSENPEQLALLRARPELLPSAIEEVLRYRSPLQAVFRATRRDVELHGQTIPRGKLVLAVIGSANRDEKIFPDADRFDITRDPNPHVAFGHGIHFCLGAALARLEAKVALTDLLLDRRFNLSRVDETPWPPRKAFHLHGPERLPVRLTAC